ncbi:cysteine protease, partial [Naganishia albida]
MVYTTWVQGFKEANTATTASLKLETTLPHTLPNLAQRIFPSYISAATLWSNLLSSGLIPASSSIAVDGPTTKAEAIKKWRMCLERADLVKKKVVGMGGTIGKAVDRVPVASSRNGVGDEAVQRAMKRRTQRDEADQISILRRSSTLQARPPVSTSQIIDSKTLHLPLWHDADATFLAPLPAAQLDAMVFQPSLSADQLAAHATWDNIYAPSHPYTEFTPCLPCDDACSKGLLKVEQGIGANCSVVAGLNTLVAHNARCGTALGSRNFVPVAVKRRKGEEESGEAVRYWRVKVFFNGAWRSLVIDSRLPASSTTTQSLHATITPLCPSTNTTSLLWLPLLEKAYMTLMGSYAFPGSTPATDIHALTGWIPERIVLSGAGFRRERTWARITEGWERGTVLVTLG